MKPSKAPRPPTLAALRKEARRVYGVPAIYSASDYASAGPAPSGSVYDRGVTVYEDNGADARITEGPIFRPVNRWGRVVQYGEQQRLWPQYVEKIVKRLMTNAGLDHKGYGAHSLRAGFITQAALNGHTESEIMRHSGHSNTKIVQRYIRIANLDKRNTTEDMGL